jgi:hypothetical protein
MKPNRKLAAATLTAAATLATLSTTPAQAADQYIWVCNDPRSVDNIVAYNTSVSGYGNHSINQGDCKSINDRGGNARVDVDPAGGEADVNSYIIWVDNYPFGGGVSYGPCHPGENGASNPDSSHVKTSHYWTSRGGCGV